MKKTLLPLILVAFLAACNTKSPEAERELLYISDSSGLQHNVNSDTATVTPPVVNIPAAPAPQRLIVRRPSTRVVNQTPVYTPPVYNPPVQAPAPAPSPEPAPVPSVDETAGTGTVATGDGEQTAEAPEKKGISKSAKGAIIGGVAGAAAGAIIGKNAKGAIIGGAVGAAGGYILGRKKDKQDGRIP